MPTPPPSAPPSDDPYGLVCHPCTGRIILGHAQASRDSEKPEWKTRDATDQAIRAVAKHLMHGEEMQPGIELSMRFGMGGKHYILSVAETYPPDGSADSSEAAEDEN